MTIPLKISSNFPLNNAIICIVNRYSLLQIQRIYLTPLTIFRRSILLMGIISGLAQVAFDPGSNTPIIGASGAVAGILGAYLVSCPRARVLALVPIFIVFTVAELPAVVFLGFWFLLQLFQGVASIGVDVSIAWWAHIAGFIGGMTLVAFFGKHNNCN